jgi:hypothetical protein
MLTSYAQTLNFDYEMEMILAGEKKCYNSFGRKKNSVIKKLLLFG